MLTRLETRLKDFPFSPPGWRPAAFEYDSRLQRLEAFVQQNFADPISLAEGARQACLTRCYFSTYFRRSLGIGFQQWLTCLRIHRATSELTRTDWPVTEIAWAVGFQDMTTFTRAFRRITGTTPSRFRRRYRCARVAEMAAASIEKGTPLSQQEVTRQSGAALIP